VAAESRNCSDSRIHSRVRARAARAKASPGARRRRRSSWEPAAASSSTRPATS
jgi:hypothetical protein